MNQYGLQMDRKTMEKAWKGLEMDRNRLKIKKELLMDWNGMKMDRAISKWTETNSKWQNGPECTRN